MKSFMDKANKIANIIGQIFLIAIPFLMGLTGGIIPFFITMGIIFSSLLAVYFCECFLNYAINRKFTPFGQEQ